MATDNQMPMLMPTAGGNGAGTGGTAGRAAPLLLLIDGHAMVHRSFRAISVNRSLTVSSTGEDVTGVYGFASVFLRALHEWQPSHVVVTFDTPEPTFRHRRFPDYKAQRPPSPPELRGQFDRVKELMRAFAVPVYELPGYEADDLIGTLSRQAADDGLETVILTGDRDTFQLVSPLVKVDLASSERDRRIVDEVELGARYGGLTAAQQPDFKALVGDKSDNIPGVPAVGEKTAANLLNQFGTLEGIYANLDAIPQKRIHNNLAEHRDAAFEYRFLTTIDRNAPVTPDWDASKFGGYQRGDVVALMTAWEFHTIVGRVPAPDALWTAAGAGVGSAGGGPASSSSASSAMSSGDDAVAAAPDYDYRIVASEAELAAMIADITAAGAFAFDTESSSTDPMDAALAGLSFAIPGGRAWYVPVGHQEGEQLPLEVALAALRPLFTAAGVSRCAHNANYDLTLLAGYGFASYGVIDHDTMIAAHLLGKNRLGLKPVALEVLGREMTEISDIIGKGRNQITFNQAGIEDGAPYAAADADCTMQLRQRFEEPLAAQGLDGLLRDVELPLVPVLVEMQRAGVRLDAGILHEMSQDLNEQLRQIETELYGDIGHAVNINSPRQLSDLLFGELGLPKTRRTKSGAFSTDANALESLKGMHPVVDGILKYREVAKLKSTYVDALPEMVNRHTGRIHTSYHQTGSATGRLSSSDPNLQNIPVRTEQGRQVRRAFVADAGHTLLSADYSQIELRVLAHLSQDASLLDAFRRGEDIHAATASQMFNVPVSRVDGEQRRIAKVLNFGVIYGLGPYGISQQTGFSREEGRQFIDTYLSRYPGINGYLESVKEQTRREMYAETLLGRRRYLPDIQSTNHNVRAAAERMAINMPVQGTAADIMKKAMINVRARMDKEGMRSRMILQVHDELVFEVPDDEMAGMTALAQDEMPAALDMDVTLKVEVKSGQSWGDF